MLGHALFNGWILFDEIAVLLLRGLTYRRKDTPLMCYKSILKQLQKKLIELGNPLVQQFQVGAFNGKHFTVFKRINVLRCGSVGEETVQI